MTLSDCNDSMLNFLKDCPPIKDNTLFFNFGNVVDNANQITINSDSVDLHKPYIDGSVEKRYTCNIDSFKSVAYIPVVSVTTDENIADYAEVQEILDWINDKGLNETYPDFGTDCFIDSMQCTSTKPALIGIEDSLNPPMAIYRIVVQIDYLDKTNCIWS